MEWMFPTLRLVFSLLLQYEILEKLVTFIPQLIRDYNFYHVIKTAEKTLGVNFINTKCQKWHLTSRKFHETLMAFKMPKFGIFTTNIGI